MPSPDATSGLPDDLIARLQCPRCQSPLADGPSRLECRACRVQYPVEDGIAALLPESAQPLTEASS